MFLMVFILLIGLAGCSAGSIEENKAGMDSGSKSSSGGEAALYSGNRDNATQTTKESANKPADKDQMDIPSKMVIYQADLQLRVKKFDQTVRSLEEKVEKYGGYIAESNVARQGEEYLSGSITIRIPQTHFQNFLHDAEGEAAEVLQRNISGQDVSEEYVDLESRLKSKRVVEERLLSFMQNATKTEDLLKISADLAAVQEEIERIEGRMKFLENQTSYSTVTITLYENKVVVPEIEKDELNTWEKTKKQFVKSTNFLLSAMSGLVVFVVGNLPILILFIIVGLIGFIYYKKRKKQTN